MIDDGDICAAEDLLFNDLDQSDSSWLQIALDFYSKLNNCSDDYLAIHDFLVKKLIKDFDTSARCLVMIFGKQLVHYQLFRQLFFCFRKALFLHFR